MNAKDDSTKETQEVSDIIRTAARRGKAVSVGGEAPAHHKIMNDFIRGATGAPQEEQEQDEQVTAKPR